MVDGYYTTSNIVHSIFFAMDARITGMKAEINGLVEKIPTDLKSSQRKLLTLYRKHFMTSIDDLKEDADIMDEATRTIFEKEVETTYQRYTQALMKIAGIPFEEVHGPLSV